MGGVGPIEATLYMGQQGARTLLTIYGSAGLGWAGKKQARLPIDSRGRGKDRLIDSIPRRAGYV